MRLHLKKLNSRGVAHHALIALLVVVAFASFGAYRVFNTKAYNFSGTQDQTIRKADGCVPGKHVVNNNCQSFAQIQTIKDDCTTYKVQYDSSTQKCKDFCKEGYKKYYGECVVNNFNTSMKPADMKASCSTQHRPYESSMNTCKDSCLDGWVWRDNKCNDTRPTQQPSTCPRGQIVVNGACQTQVSCTGPHQVYNPRSNTCGCDTDFTMQNGTCVASSTAACPTNQVRINGTCETKAQCNRQHTQYDAARNTCVCVSGYERNASTKECDKTKSPTNTPTDQCGTTTARCITPAQVKASCDAQFLQYDSAANKCKEGCKAGYVKKDGKCIDQAEAQNTMTERLCRALGRDWVTPDIPNPATGHAKPAYCSNECVDTDGSKFVPTEKDITSYCKATVTGSLGASPDISQADCATQHRIYLTAAKVCSARCTTGWYLKDSGCYQLAANAGENNNGDGEGEEGGCLGGQQPTTDGTCQEDTIKDPVKDPTVLKLDSNIDKKTCELLGREWESGTKDANGKKIKGCNVEKCDKKDVKIVKPENGKPYCQGYVLKIDKPQCEALHRVWIAESKACAASPNQDNKAGDKKNGARMKKSDKCEPPYTTYVYKTGKPDECLKPSTVDKLQSIAKATGTPFVKLTNMSQAGICNIQPHKHWTGSKCAKDKPGTHNTGQGGDNTGGDGKDPASTPGGGGVTAAFCATLGRPYDGNGGCKRSCTASGYVLTNVADSNQWDRCVRDEGHPGQGTTGPGSGPPPLQGLSCLDFKKKFGAFAEYCSIGDATSANYYRCPNVTTTNPHTKLVRKEARDADVLYYTYYCD